MIPDMTTVIALVALVLSVTSLVFTGYQWRRSGAVLTIDLTPAQKSREDDQRETYMIFEAEITSDGRLPATVREIRMAFFQGGECIATEPPVEVSQPLPARLAPTDVLVASFRYNGNFGAWRGFKFAVQAKAGRRWFASTTRELVRSSGRR